MESFTAQESANLLKTEADQTLLLDIREDMELEQASIAGAMHIPMGQIPERLDEIDKSKRIIVICHSGGRSAQVAGYLASLEYQAFNLTGGIMAWANDVDPSVGEY
jgi:rhodanese-related sulfurtransferase